MRHYRAKGLFLVLAGLFAATGGAGGCGCGRSEPQAEPPASEPAPKPETTEAEPRWDVSKPPSLVSAKSVRPAAAAGRFYPGTAETLRKDISERLQRAGEPPGLPGKLRALIVPHAGYRYSADTAAAAYAAANGRSFDRSVLLGPAHRYPLRGVSVSGAGFYQTPLGPMAVDTGFANKLRKEAGAAYVEAAHAREHSLEVQLPFLQAVIGPGVRIVPVLVGPDPAAQARIARALSELLDERTLVVVSTDLSHRPALRVVQKVDAATVESWKTLDLDLVEAAERRLMSEGHKNLACTMCGGDAVRVLMRLAPLLGIDAVKVLKLDTSATASGDAQEVVGYAAAAFCATGRRPARPAQRPTAGADTPHLSAEGRRKLLKIAREAAAAAAADRSLARLDPGALPEELRQPGGAFVTLRKKGHLRGCIGRYPGEESVAEVVRQMAAAAATRDLRFRPVTSGEMDEIDIEISVLSPLRRIDDWRKIRLGVHGVVLRRGRRQGVFLPQVATETGWKLEEFLSHLARDKARLAPDTYRDPATEILVFTALVFGEKEEASGGE